LRPRDVAVDGSGHLLVAACNGSHSIVSPYDVFTSALLNPELAISGGQITSLDDVAPPPARGVAANCTGRF
jgi:hypothetical protein